ncbi:hypothetical protein BDV96DRAFT_607868 [Lophiotrema nucula]|uniref:Heterokaryon incompatibility domain-containing protein n=1 Tax=Lophiotrema nucula TaxID=690887 RepID=A0A6A5YEY1_9PLEO|nr:hypothetical protein BDV96DRAFT_607868 [Lophiotrema nucula]
MRVPILIISSRKRSTHESVHRQLHSSYEAGDRIMRLLNTKTLAFAEHGQPPFDFRYAIFSHTWTDHEVSYKDITSKKAMTDEETKKLKKFLALAIAEGCEWCWMDTCCIDFSLPTGTERNEAILSSYTWFRHAYKCFVYLADIDASDDLADAKYFSRTWSLIELLAPENMTFYDRNWKAIGSKKELAPALSNVTNIAEDVLRYARDPIGATTGEKLYWASERKALYPEEGIYALIPLLGVRMIRSPGEGRSMAIVRMQEQILTNLEDYTILMWRKPLGLASRQQNAIEGDKEEDPESFLSFPEWNKMKSVSPIDMMLDKRFKRYLPPLETLPDSPQLTGRGLRVSLLTKTVSTFMGQWAKPYIIAWTYCTQEKYGYICAVCIRVVLVNVFAHGTEKYLRGATSGQI